MFTLILFLQKVWKRSGREGLNKPKVKVKNCRFVKYARPFVTTTPAVKGLRNKINHNLPEADLRLLQHVR